jgi:hypothetical protein
MNRALVRSGSEPLLSAQLVLPAILVAIAAFPAYAIDDPTFAATLQQLAESVAIVNASIATLHGGQFSIRTGVTLSGQSEGGAAIVVRGEI